MALCDPDRCRAALQYSPCSLDPMPAATLRRIIMKALARYQVILLGEQRHIRCEQLAQGCCPNSAAAGVEPATSRVQRSNHYTTEPPLTSCHIWHVC